MSWLTTPLRLILATVLLWVMVAPLAADDAAPGTPPWQEVITSQIEAFRNHDAPSAFSYAGAGFQTSYPSAEAFFAAIVTSGYAPIMESSSHSFGAYDLVGAGGVVQVVRLVGKDQEIYEARYQLTEEDRGWRVQGVQLVRRPGIAI